jgi:hypothetical protein
MLSPDPGVPASGDLRRALRELPPDHLRLLERGLLLRERSDASRTGGSRLSILLVAVVVLRLADLGISLLIR